MNQTIATYIYRDKYNLYKFATSIPTDWERDAKGKQVVDERGRSKRVEVEHVNIEDLAVKIDEVNRTPVSGGIAYDYFRNPATKTITDNTGKEAAFNIAKAIERYEQKFGVTFGHKALIRD